MSTGTQGLFTVGEHEKGQTYFSIPNIHLMRTIAQTRLEATLQIQKKEGTNRYQIYSALMTALLDATARFDDLSHALNIASDFARTVRDEQPELVPQIIEKALTIYQAGPMPQPIATRMAYSKLRMYLAQFRLEYVKDIMLADVRATVYHSIPIIQELNFILVLIKAKRYLKASLFLKEIAPLFEVQGRVDVRIALPFFELTCLANLGAKTYAPALEALDRGYAIAQQLPKATHQASRFITLFEKVVKFFDTKNEGDEPNVEELKVPGVIFDLIYLHTEYCPDPEGILVEV